MFRTNLNAMRGLERPNQVEITVDGEQILLVAAGGEKDRTVTVAFLQKLPTQDTRRLENFLRSSADTIDNTGRPHAMTHS
jgi:hypothetical protein